MSSTVPLGFRGSAFMSSALVTLGSADVAIPTNDGDISLTHRTGPHANPNFSGSRISKLERTKAFQDIVTRDHMLFMHSKAFQRGAMYIFQASVDISQKRSVQAPTKIIINLDSCSLTSHL